MPSSNLFGNLLCSLFAIFCLSPAPSITPQAIIENPVLPQEFVIIETSENNENYFLSTEEGIISKIDWEGIVDFEETIAISTSTQATSTEIIIAINQIESFAAAPAVYAPKDFAPVDPVGDKYAAWLKTAWINTVTTTIQHAVVITDDSVLENVQDNTTSTSSISPVEYPEQERETDLFLEEIIPIVTVTSTVTSTLHLIINAISIGTASSTLDEFVEIYNPTTESMSLDGWKLQRVTASGKTENYLVRPFPSDKSIASQGYFLIVHPDGYSTTTPEAMMPDLVYTTATSIASSNIIILFNGQSEVVDLVGYGEASQFEGAPASELKNDGQALVRTEASDTDQNNADFTLANYKPHNSESSF